MSQYMFSTSIVSWIADIDNLIPQEKDHKIAIPDISMSLQSSVESSVETLGSLRGGMSSQKKTASIQPVLLPMHGIGPFA